MPSSITPDAQRGTKSPMPVASRRRVDSRDDQSGTGWRCVTTWGHWATLAGFLVSAAVHIYFSHETLET